MFFLQYMLSVLTASRLNSKGSSLI